MLRSASIFFSLAAPQNLSLQTTSVLYSPSMTLLWIRTNAQMPRQSMPSIRLSSKGCPCHWRTSRLYNQCNSIHGTRLHSTQNHLTRIAAKRLIQKSYPLLKNCRTCFQILSRWVSRRKSRVYGKAATLWALIPCCGGSEGLDKQSSQKGNHVSVMRNILPSGAHNFSQWNWN